MQTIDLITGDILTGRANAFYLNSTGDMADLLMEGMQYPGSVSAVFLKKGSKIIFKESTKSFTTKAAERYAPFTLIASKHKKSLDVEFVLFDQHGEIICSSYEEASNDISGFFLVGFGNNLGSYTILLAVNISANGINTTNLIIEGDESHCDAIAKLTCFAYEGDNYGA